MKDMDKSNYSHLLVTRWLIVNAVIHLVTYGSNCNENPPSSFAGEQLDALDTTLGTKGSTVDDTLQTRTEQQNCFLKYGPQ